VLNVKKLNFNYSLTGIEKYLQSIKNVKLAQKYIIQPQHNSSNLFIQLALVESNYLIVKLTVFQKVMFADKVECLLVKEH
jgi:hypothetical protein